LSCPKCREAAEFKGYRKCVLQTLLGAVLFRRAYYHCEHCRKGWFPSDADLEIEGKQTLAAREVMTLAGILHPFAEGAEQVLERMSGLRVSASTVQRTTEATGADVAAQQAAHEPAAFPEQAWNWARDTTGRRVAYVSLDATAVPQQGKHGEKMDGRMPYVGAVFNPQKQKLRTRAARRLWDVHYAAGLLSLDEMARRLRWKGEAVGMEHADVIVCLTDGGSGLEECLQRSLSGLTEELRFVLDFHHACEHLTEFAQRLWPDDSPNRRVRTEAWCHELKTLGGERLLDTLKQLDLSAAPPHVLDDYRKLTNYLRANLHRMDYPTYLANGWQIGSGIVESACKTIVTRRLKLSGMRWREPGTNALCHLRALYLSSHFHWENYWNRTVAG
jgi:hypothetical protein